MSKRDFDEARSLLDEVLSAEVENFEAKYTLAVLNRAEGQIDQAKTLLKALVNEKPDLVVASKSWVFVSLHSNKSLLR